MKTKQMAQENMKTAIFNIFMNYSPQECDYLSENIDTADWTCHILHSLVYIRCGDISAVNDYFREIYEEEGILFEENEDDTPTEELMTRHIADVVNYYLADEEKDFRETADFTNRDEFNKLMKEHNLYDLVVLSEDGDEERVEKYFKDIWEENKN